jgi:CheY-like chemotaxis protein
VNTPPLILILNTNIDTVELLRMALEMRGLLTTSAMVDELKRGEVDVEAILRLHKPSAILYDVPIPYDLQWAFMERFRAHPLCKGIPFVITSTNVTRLREFVNTKEPVLEIVGKPYDLDEVVAAVKRAVGLSE